MHKYAEEFAKGKKPKMPDDENAKNGVLGFLRWIEDAGLELKYPEKHVYSKKYDYAGIVDVDARRKKKLVVVEYKTSNGIYDEHRYQAAAQQQALEEMTGKKYDERWLAHFDKNTGEFRAILLDEFEKDMKAFLGCIAIRNRAEDLKYRASQEKHVQGLTQGLL